MSVVIAKTDDTSSVTIYPDEALETPIVRKLDKESITGLIYSKTRKIRRAWSIKAVITATDKSAIETLGAESYVNFTIDSLKRTCILRSFSFNPLRKWGDFIYELSMNVEERGW
jgi:hypothetical protein